MLCDWAVAGGRMRKVLEMAVMAFVQGIFGVTEENFVMK
jgi:hypothetical protein